MADAAPPPIAGTSAETPGGLPPELATALATAREQGQAAAQAMAWRRIEALAQRAAAHQGAVRQLLQARLRALLAGLSGAPAPITRTSSPEARAPAQALRALVTRLHGAAPAAGTLAAAPRQAEPMAPGALPELKVVRQHRAAWARLRAEQRVAQAQVALPEQAGPLNSHRLLHRALSLMRETAPGYLQHFLHQAEALAWLEQTQATPAAEARPAARAKVGKAAPRPAAPARARRR